MSYQIKLEKRGKYRTNPDKIKSQIDFIIGRATAGDRSRWNCDVTHVTDPILKDGLYSWTRILNFQRVWKKGTTPDPSRELFEWNTIKKVVEKATQQAKAGGQGNPWVILGDVSRTYDDVVVEQKLGVEKKFAEINLEKSNWFDELYGLEHQINVIYRSIKALNDSNLQHRHHCICYGPPACGKSQTLLAFANMLGEDERNYIKLDATNMTTAGVTKLLMEADELPSVLILEEAEKIQSPHLLSWLLGVMDARGEIRRINFRTGPQARNVRMLVLATANNIKEFRKLLAGALASRFSHEIYFPRPSREVLYKILEREIKKIDGDMKWADKALEFAYDELGIDDPRKILPIALDGKEALMDGSYQESIRKTRRPKKPVDPHTEAALRILKG